MKQRPNGRARFTLVDLIRALQGFGSPENYLVMPNDIAQQMLSEVERLYGVEQTARELLMQFSGATSPSADHEAVTALREWLEAGE